MAKGHKANREHLEEVHTFGKAIGRRAGFRCEWCDGKDDLRVWEYRPDQPPNMDTLALLCRGCRSLADGARTEENSLRSIRNALWSNVSAVAEGAASVLVQCREPWVREAIEESFIDDAVKAALLKKAGK